LRSQTIDQMEDDGIDAGASQEAETSDYATLDFSELQARARTCSGVCCAPTHTHADAHVRTRPTLDSPPCGRSASAAALSTSTGR